jgi:membrane-bound lytic murein transglycosylase B
MTEARLLKEWTDMGVTNLDDSALPTADIKASLVRGPVRHFLVYKNYDALLEYNCSNSYAVGIGLMADQIGAK